MLDFGRSRQEEINNWNLFGNFFAAVHQAAIFSCRARGNYKNGSDVDIALKGKTIPHEIASEIKY